MMNERSEAIEAVRERYRPKQILTLFVGESAPKSGEFFYYGNTTLARHIEQVMKASGMGGDGDFLEQACGWYLDDLVLTPVDHLPPGQRRKKCRDAQEDLARRITEYRPLAVVTILLRIKDIVEAAAITADSNIPRYAVPFPGQGQQARFKKEMAHIILMLPRERIK